MNIRKITIEFSPKPNNDFEKSLASKAIFENGCWTFDGPMKSSYHGLVHEIWKLVRTRLKEDNDTNDN